MSYPISSSLLDGIVLAVVERESTYGYRITQDVQKVLDISESTLYPVLRRLMKDGCLYHLRSSLCGPQPTLLPDHRARQSRSAERPHRLAELPERDRHDLFWRGERMKIADYMALAPACAFGFAEEERAQRVCVITKNDFDDAGPENEAKAIEELGEPAKVAAQILADYRELTAIPHAQPIKRSAAGAVSVRCC